MDSLRPEAKENCATSAEKAAAWKETEAVAAHLDSLGWPRPVWVDSGNGFYLLYRINLPNDEPERLLLRSLLHALHDRFPGAKIDRAVHNAARIIRLPGTWNQKGRNRPDRPHRTCRLLSVPETLEVVSREMLALAAGGEQAAQETPKGTQKSNPFKGKASDTRLQAYCRRALNDEVLAVAMAVRGHEGGHGANNTLNEAAFAMGTILGWEVLDEIDVIDALTAAARRAGLEEGEILPTIMSGLEAGKRSLRRLPVWAEKGENPPPDGDRKPPKSKTRWQFTFGNETLAEGDPDFVRDTLSDPDLDAGISTRHFEILTVGDLMARDFPEPEWVIKGVMSEGLNILAGAPKQGKSMLALNIALTVAGGGKALGDVQVSTSDVLYLSLEDKHRRVKHRASKMLGKIREGLSESVSSRLAIATDWPRQDEGGLKLIDLWANKVSKPGLVIIDVWNRFAPVMQRQGNAYSHDAEAMGAVKRFAERRGFTILIIHHTRKPGMKDPEDFVHEISGTMGLSGAADGILVLMRSRQSQQASLHVTGRDVAEQEIVLEFDENSLTWTSLGKRADHVEGRVQEKVVRFLRSQRPTPYFIKDIAEQINEKDDSVKKACVNLLRNKLVRKTGHAFSYPGEAIDPEGAETEIPF